MPTISRARWRSWSPDDEVFRRAGGRRRYNWQRQIRVELRRNQVARYLAQVGSRRGYQAELAQRLHVHPSTISRDVATVLGEWREHVRSGAPLLRALDYGDDLL